MANEAIQAEWRHARRSINLRVICICPWRHILGQVNLVLWDVVLEVCDDCYVEPFHLYVDLKIIEVCRRVQIPKHAFMAVKNFVMQTVLQYRSVGTVRRYTALEIPIDNKYSRSARGCYCNVRNGSL